MKKLKGVILFASLAFFNIGIVKAENRCDTLKMNAENSNFEVLSSIYMNYSHNGIDSHPYYKYFFMGDGGEYITYCRNAGYSSGKQPGANKTYSCKETIFDPSSSNEEEKIYHAGIMGILINGYNNFNNNYSNADTGYVVTNIALRVYEMLWEKFNTNGINGTALNRAHQFITNLMLDDREIQSLLSEATGRIRTKYSNPLAVTQIGGEAVSLNNSIIKEARRLIVIGLQESIDYKKNGAATVTYKKPQVSKKSKGNGVYEATLTFNITAEKFRGSDSYLNLNFDCPKCKSYGVTYKTYINDREMSINGVNLLSRRDKDNKINLKVVLTSKANFNCELLNYTLDIKYKDKSLMGEAYNMQADGFSSSASIQQFYLLYSTDTVREEKFTADVDICSLDCNEIKKMCEAGNAEMCKRLNEEYGGDCVECTAFISPVKCDANDQELYIKEGLELDSANQCNTNKDSELNILQCIVNNSDQAGNPYKAAKLTSNKYCSVYCKEDYHFVLPGVKEVRSGRYFTLQASVDGSKSCYTSKIDTKTFENDLETSRKAIIDAFNVWSRLYAVVHAKFENIHTINNRYQSGQTYTGTCGKKPNTYSCTKCQYTSTHDCKTTQASKTFTYKVCDYNSCHDKTETEIYGYAKSVSNKCGSGTCETKDYLTHYKEKGYEEKLGELQSYIDIADLDPTTGQSYSTGTGAYGKLQSEINKYFLILNSYNSCGGKSDASFGTLNSIPFKYGWKMDYKYDAKISYWYQEQYMLDVKTDHLSTLGNVKVDSDYKQTNCYGNVSKDYKCQASSDNSKTAAINSKPQFMCILKGDKFECNTYSVAVSNAQYVSQEMGMAGEYITPTQFQRIYPTNAIVVADENEEIENASVLPNGLPVSAGTSQGVYTYALKVENLGEYYSGTTNLGRIWGADNSVVVSTLEKLEACYKNSAIQDDLNIDNTNIDNGVYVCAYRVNCPDCPIDCDEEGCEWEDCPTNKCPIDCDNCIITNGNYNFNYRPVTPGNLNPNNRPLGNNWNWDNNITDAIELKAYTTTKEIETTGEEIYDTTKDSYVMKVTMDSSLISAIREYHDQNGENYLNNTLKCYDLEENGNKYKNVFCYSTFLDQMISEHRGNFKINKDRPESVAERKNSNKSDYWTTWTKAVANETWNITTINTVEVAKINKVDAKSTNYKNEIGIGPSWK